MKFGKNLAHLSIPEWKVYNVDYNDLKATIRECTRQKSSDLLQLRQKFIDNFDYLNLFVMTKAGELERRLKVDIGQFMEIKRSYEDKHAAQTLARLNTLHFDVINEISIEVRKLTKFIVVQKIAVKKIFKKLAKHFHDQAASKALISELTIMLHNNPYSFLNFDLSKVTTDLLFILNEIDSELRYLLEQIHRAPNTLVESNLKKSGSGSTIKSLKGSLFSRHSLDELNVDANFGAADQIGKFDLITVLKKNFSLHSLIPKDIASRNDLSLTLDVYLSIPKISDSCKASIIYLTHPDETNPSWIMSYEDLPLSIIMAFTGGLRKYSYCCLLRNMVSVILAYLNEEDDMAKEHLSNKISDYISCGGLSSMTRTTLDFILNCNLTPLLQLTYDRTRYFLSYKPSQHEETSALPTPVAPLTPDSTQAPCSTIDKKKYEDSFYMILDENIYTSNIIASKVSFDTTRMDPFPFNSFSIYSNDLHLHTFADQVITEINGNVLQSKPPLSALNKLPCKIQNLIKCAPIHVFKGFSIFDYMNSCYFNKIPENSNNHYSRLLNLNLLKNYENVEIANKQQTLDKSIIQTRSKLILHRQESCKSLLTASLPERPSLVQTNKTASVKSLVATPVNETPFVIHSTDYPSPRASDLENYSEENVSEDGYLMYLGFQNDLEDNIFNQVMLAFVKIKYRSLRAFRAFNLMDSEDLRWRSREKRPLDIYNEPMYDSINEDPTFFNNGNDYQIQFMHDYDSVVSFLCYCLCFGSLFITGINLGILCSLLNLRGRETRLNISDNPILVLCLVVGFLFALIFSMGSINLHFQQFRTPPVLLSSILWVSLVFVNITIMWSIAQITL